MRAIVRSGLNRGTGPYTCPYTETDLTLYYTICIIRNLFREAAFSIFTQ